jgi:hypothetical protein
VRENRGRRRGKNGGRRKKGGARRVIGPKFGVESASAEIWGSALKD